MKIINFDVYNIVEKVGRMTKIDVEQRWVMSYEFLQLITFFEYYLRGDV